VDNGLTSSPSAQRRRAAWWWLLLVLVLAVLVGGTVIGLHVALPPTDTVPRPAAATSPAVQATAAPPVTTPTPSRLQPGAPVVIKAGDGPLLPGIGAGQVYVQSATGIFWIELATGRITRTATPDLQEHSTFLAGSGWVLVKSRWSSSGVLVRDGQPASPLAHQFDAEGFLHAGPRGRLWMEPEPGTDPTASTTLQLADLDGQLLGRSITAPRSAAPYAIAPDGHGGVLMTNRGGVYLLESGRPRQATHIRLVSRGDLIAAGGRRLLVWDCDPRARCEMVLVDQRTGHRTLRPATARTLLAEGGISIDRNDYGDVSLSPDGTHLAVMANDSAGTFRTHVIDLRSGRDTLLPGAGPDSNVNRQLTWSTNSRWLLALTDHQIRAYDTSTHTTTDVPLDGEHLLHLTASNDPGW
jgi:hypothetical protein